MHSYTFLPTQDIKQTKNKGEQEKPLDNKTVATTDTMQPNNNKQTYVFVASPCQTQSKDKDGHQVNNCNKSVTIPSEMKQQNKEHTFGKKTVSNFDETQPKNNGRPLIMSGIKPVLDQDQLQPRKAKGPENLHYNSIKPVVNQDQLQPKNTKGSENLHGNKSISGKVKPLIINGIEPVLDQYQLQPRNIKEPENPRDFKSIEASGQVKPLIMSSNKPLLDQDQLQPKNTKGQENLHDNKSIATSDQVKPLLMSGIKPELDQYQLQPKNTKGSENPHDYKSIEISVQVKPLLMSGIKPVLDQDQIQPKNTKVPENLRDIKPIATSGQVKPKNKQGNYGNKHVEIIDQKELRSKVRHSLKKGDISKVTSSNISLPNSDVMQPIKEGERSLAEIDQTHLKTKSESAALTGNTFVLYLDQIQPENKSGPAEDIPNTEDETEERAIEEADNLSQEYSEDSMVIHADPSETLTSLWDIFSANNLNLF